MDKQQLYNSFWQQASGLTAYEENAIPDNATLPYCTYQTITDSLSYAVFPAAHIWDNNESWETLDAVLNRITGFIGTGKTFAVDGGGAFICKGSPFAQRTTDDTGAKGYLINIQVEFFTEV